MTKKSAVTAETASLIFQRHFGRTPKLLKPIHGGLANHVFQMRLGGEELVLRISEKPAKLQVFMKEQWAVAAARRKGIPTPEILEVCNDVGGLPYMISRKVVGFPADLLGQHRAAVLHELGQYTARINAIKTHDFGHIFDWSPNRLSRNRTWKEYLDHELKLDERVEIFQQSRILEPGNLKKLRRQLEQMKQWTETPTLNHGDIRLKNVILDEKQKITAILDWENCTSHIPPYWELSIALHDLTMDEKQCFLEGYGLNLKQYMKISPAIKALNILNYARVIRHGLERKDHKRLLNLRARLNGTFDLYSL